MQFFFFAATATFAVPIGLRWSFAEQARRLPVQPHLFDSVTALPYPCFLPFIHKLRTTRRSPCVRNHAERQEGSRGPVYPTQVVCFVGGGVEQEGAGCFIAMIFMLENQLQLLCRDGIAAVSPQLNAVRVGPGTEADCLGRLSLVCVGTNYCLLYFESALCPTVVTFFSLRLPLLRHRSLVARPPTVWSPLRTTPRCS